MTREGFWQTRQKKDKRQSQKKIKSNSHVTKSCNSTERKNALVGTFGLSECKEDYLSEETATLRACLAGLVLRKDDVCL